MTVTQYMSSLPMDTRYYLLDHSSEPDKVKEVVGDKANNSAFLAELMKFIQATQEKRVSDAKQQAIQKQQMLDDSLARLKIAPGIIEALTGKFRHFCKNCGASIESGDLCDKCKGN